MYSKINTFIKKILLLICTTSIGCTHFAHRKYACEDLFQKNFGFPAGAAVFIGNAFQVGDCSIFRDFKIETGDYYRQHKEMIDFEIKIYDSKSVRSYDNLINFAKAYNCENDTASDFIKELIRNQQNIFGTDFSKSARSVSLEVIKMINADERLKNRCQ